MNEKEIQEEMGVSYVNSRQADITGNSRGAHVLEFMKRKFKRIRNLRDYEKEIRKEQM